MMGIRDICAAVMRLAEEIIPQTRLHFTRSDKVEAREYNAIHFELQRFVATVRQNEGLEATVARIDDDEEMLLLVGFSDHEARDAVVEELERQAKKMAKKANIELKVE
jgi:hypothetical protein